MKSLNRKQKIIISITGIFIVLLALVGLTYAYFLTQITGNGNPKSISVTTANLRLVYADEDDQYVIGEDEIIEPNTTFEPKTFTVTNTGNGKVDEYAVILDNVSITYANTTDKVTEGDVTTLGSTTEGKENDFTLVITCKNQDDEACNGYNAELLETSGILLTNSIEVGETQTYTATLTYNDTGHNQSADMNKRYNGRFNIIDTKDTIDIGGTVSNYEKGDYVQTNSTKRVSVIYPDGTYKVMGLEAGQHRIRVFDKTGKTTKLDKTINIVKGSTAGVSGTTITMTPESRLATINIKSSDIEVGEIKDFERQKNLLKDAILARAKSGISGASVYTNDSYATIKNNTSAKYLAQTEDENGGTSYYFRGNVKDNFVNFAEKCWKIVRIEEDGSVKLILTANQKCETIENIRGIKNTIGEGIYGYKTLDNEIDSAEYGKIEGKESSDTIKAKLDTWYKANLASFDSSIKAAQQCIGDITTKYGATQLYSTNDKSWYKLTSSTQYFYKYSAFSRVKEINEPTLQCDGVKTEKLKIYPLTVDEVLFSGAEQEYKVLFSDTQTNNSYLFMDSNRTWVTLNPIGGIVAHDGYYDGEYHAPANIHFAVMAPEWGITIRNIEASMDIRPAISLIPGITITDGTGVIGDPYIIG